MRYPTRSAAIVAAVIATLALASAGLAQYREYYAYGRVLDAQKKPLPAWRSVSSTPPPAAAST